MKVEIIVNNKLYDVTDFVDDHPGGDYIIKKFNGQDATEDYEDVGHSKYADELLGQFYIKNIEGKESYIEKIEDKDEKKLSCLNLFYNYVKTYFISNW